MRSNGPHLQVLYYRYILITGVGIFYRCITDAGLFLPMFYLAFFMCFIRRRNIFSCVYTGAGLFLPRFYPAFSSLLSGAVIFFVCGAGKLQPACPMAPVYFKGGSQL
jgi:hypothetical protein